MELDSLGSRERRVALFERYGRLLTDHQREVLELYLAQDWSLSEIASERRISRAAVHDIVRRAMLSMQDYEVRLGLLTQQDRNRDVRAAMARELAEMRRRVTKLEERLGEIA